MNQPTHPQCLLHTFRSFAAGGVAAALLFALAPALTAQTPASTVEILRKNFVNPPNQARPMVRWWWFGPAVVKPEILRELEQMKANGIQGAELAFVYPEVLDDPAKGLKNLSFLSPKMLDDIAYAQSEGRKLGLRIDVTLCSGWPYGAPHITLEEAVTALHTFEVPAPAGSTTAQIPGGNSLAANTRGLVWSEGDSVISAAIADPAAAAPPGTAPGRRGRAAGGPRPPTFDAATAKPIDVTGTSASFAATDKPRIAVFFVASHTRQQVKRAAVDADGYVLDPYSHEAVAKHLEKVGEPLIKAFGDTPPYAIFSDSLEEFGADWTPKLPEEFRKRRGYDLIPHLPELVAGGTPEADNVRHDYGKTLTELVDENYLKQIADWAAAHHTRFRSQTYHEAAVSFSSQNIPQLAEGEGPQWRAFSTLRWATSANHVFGHDVTSGETFTWLHSPVFRATPLDMKAEADIDFVMGENQIVCHGWPYSAPDSEVPEPGWSLYAAASFNNHNPWHPVMPAVTAYIGRMSYLLRQGQPANQVAILLPNDDVWAGFRPTQTGITGVMGPHVTSLMPPILSAGYNVDYIDAEAMGKVGLGTHQILVLPPTDRIPLETLRKIDAFVAKGGKAIAVGRAPSIDPEGKTIPELTTLSQRLFNADNSTLIPDEAHLADALNKAVKPDFQLPADDSIARSQLGFIRRKLPSADVYFVANTSNQPIDTTASFATAHKYGEAWDTDSTAVGPASAESFPIHLAPYESHVFVFSNSQSAPKPAAPGRTMTTDIGSAWKVTFPGIHMSVNEPALTDWISDPSTLHYSGEAVYSRDVNMASAPTHPVYLEVNGGKPLPGAPNATPERSPVPEVLGPDSLPNPLITRTGPGIHAYYDPPIHEAALVTINGQPAGALWHPPYRLDVTKFLHAGVNHVEFHVFNTALNAWSALPPHDYGPLIAKYGDRFQMQDLTQVMPISSGLLGDVRLVAEIK
jgi:alpha-L-rhamnosidase